MEFLTVLGIFQPCSLKSVFFHTDNNPSKPANHMGSSLHMQKITDKPMKASDVMRCLARHELGAERTALTTIYTGLIRSVLDYGCVVYAICGFEVVYMCI